MIWFVFSLGLLLGFLVGVVLDDALDLYRSSRKDRPMDKPAARRVPIGVLAIVLIVTVVVQAGVGVLLILQRQELADYVACKSQYDQQAAASSTARLQMAEDVDSAMDALIQAVADEDQQGFGKALATYQQLRDQQSEQRKNIPPPPEKVCGAPQEVNP